MQDENKELYDPFMHRRVNQTSGALGLCKADGSLACHIYNGADFVVGEADKRAIPSLQCVKRVLGFQTHTGVTLALLVSEDTPENALPIVEEK